MRRGCTVAGAALGLGGVVGLIYGHATSHAGLTGVVVGNLAMLVSGCALLAGAVLIVLGLRSRKVGS